MIRSRFHVLIRRRFLGRIRLRLPELRSARMLSGVVSGAYDLFSHYTVYTIRSIKLPKRPVVEDRVVDRVEDRHIRLLCPPLRRLRTGERDLTSACPSRFRRRAFVPCVLYGRARYADGPPSRCMRTARLLHAFSWHDTFAFSCQDTFFVFLASHVCVFMA